MKVALDTNILAYAEGLDEADKRDTALDIIARLPAETIVIPCQTLGELFNVLFRKGGRSREAARDALLAWSDAFSIAATTPEIMLTATDLAKDHHLSIWDAVILAVSAKAGCRLLLSEDMQNGFTWGGITVVNPFAEQAHPLLRAALGA